MAGYLVSLDSETSLIDCINNGAYATRVSDPRPNHTHQTSVEGTFADYASMKAGDNIYFFIDRKVYGIGTLVNVGPDCRYLNYPNSNEPTKFAYSDIGPELLLNKGTDSLKQRFICFFQPNPHFFTYGIDMDEMLGSAPEKFKILRVFWKLSFIKFPDSENQAFKDLIFRRNEGCLTDDSVDGVFNTDYMSFHQQALNRINSGEYRFGISPLITSVLLDNGSLSHEMAVEASLIFQIRERVENTIEVFGEWDYLSHQVVASPFKPVDYMDKMDVFGYRFIIDQEPTISKFLIIEIKRSRVRSADVLQLMKYVDWIKNEYAYGDYSMIEAYLVGASFHDEVYVDFQSKIERNFIQGFRPAVAVQWENMKLVHYVYNEDTELLDFIVRDTEIY